MRYTEVFQDSRYQFWLLQLLGWSGWITLFTLRDAYWDYGLHNLPVLIPDALVGACLTTCLRYAYKAVWEQPVAVRTLTVLTLSYAAAAIWQPFKNYFSCWYEADCKMLEEFGWQAYFSGILGYSYFVMLGWSGLYFGLKFYRLLQEEIQRNLRLAGMAHEAELRMLRYQLNPHFLFNTLNAISTLILDQQTQAAGGMVSRLSNFLRYSLDKDPMQKVDLQHELDALRLYLDIEQVRFAERLRVEVDVSDAALRALVPSLLLQPLVENSIKYAIAISESGGTITISGRREGEDLVLVVADDGPGIEIEAGREPTFSGVGLVNTRERLAELYGERQRCEIRNQQPHGLVVELRLPFEEEGGS